MVKNLQHALLTSSLFIITFAILFILRGFDDNSLTRWQWIFASTNPARIFLILIVGMILACVISKVSFPERYSAALLFLSSFFISAIFWREPELMVDASRYFTQAKHLKIYGIGYFFKEWGKDITAWTDLPLIPFLYGLIFRFVGESRIYLQIFTTTLFSATVTLTYMIGKTLWNKDIGFFAGGLLLAIPYLFTQVPIMLVDVPTLFFFTLAIFAFIKALDHDSVTMIAFASLTLFLAFISKYSTWLMLSVLVVIFLIYLKNNTSRVIYRTAIITLIAGFLVVVMLVAKLDVISEQIILLMNFQKPGLRRWGESFTSTFFFQIHPFITAAALVSIYLAIKKKDLKCAITSWLLLLVVLLQIKRIRYIILVFPMLTLMASYGLQVVQSKAQVKLIVTCIVISSLVVSLFAYLPFVQRLNTVNLKKAGEFLDTIEPETVEVFTLPQKYSKINPAVSVPILDLFTKKKIVYHYDASHIPPRNQIEKSSVRFTWEYKNPEYYSYDTQDLKGNAAIAIIFCDLNQGLPGSISQRLKDYEISKVFKATEKIFRYQVLVKVYQHIQ